MGEYKSRGLTRLRNAVLAVAVMGFSSTPLYTAKIEGYANPDKNNRFMEDGWVNKEFENVGVEIEVEKGDSLWAIARELKRNDVARYVIDYRVIINYIAKINGIKNPHKIYPNQKIYVPLHGLPEAYGVD